MSHLHPPDALEPEVSVVVPAYNHESYIEQCLSSIARQTHPDFEVIVVNDGSTDRTGAIIDRFVDTHDTEARFVVIHQANGGAARALNRGIRESRGKFVAAIASDDYMLERRVERQAAYLSQHPEVSLVHSYVQRVDPKGNELGSMRGQYVPAEGNPYHGFLLGTVGVCSPSMMFRRSAFDAVGGFDETLPVEDWPFYLRLARDGHLFGFIDDELTCWRWLPQSAGKTTSRHWRPEIAELERHLALLPSEQAKLIRAQIMRRVFKDAVLQGNYRDAKSIFPLMVAADRRPAALMYAGRVAVHRTAQLAVPTPLYRGLRALRYRFRPKGPAQRQ